MLRKKKVVRRVPKDRSEKKIDEVLSATEERGLDYTSRIEGLKVEVNNLKEAIASGSPIGNSYLSEVVERMDKILNG